MKLFEIKEVLQEMGSGANKRLGQHFLLDTRVLDKIIDAADIQPGETVLEIGPGLGVLTRRLIEAGARVIAIERDRRFVEYLNTHVFDRSGTSSFARGGSGIELHEDHSSSEIVSGDAAELDWMALVEDKTWKFVANLPYSITSFALRQALYNTNPPAKIVVLIQKEVAERAIAKEQKQSMLSLMVALASSSAKIIAKAPPSSFYPPPKVDSVVLEIMPMSLDERMAKWGMNPEEVMKIVKQGFAHPRKKLSSNLGLTTERAMKLLPDTNTRAEDMTTEQWVTLTMSLREGSATTWQSS